MNNAFDWIVGVLLIGVVLCDRVSSEGDSEGLKEPDAVGVAGD
jgi:hypothetical protein